MQSESAVTIELNPKERRLYDRLRGRIVRSQPNAPSGVRDLLLLLPDLTVLLARLLGDGRVPIGSKAIAVLGVGYVLSPLDFMPTIIFGPIGLVDDLFIVSMALSRVLNHVHPDVVRSHWSGQGDALDAVQRATSWAEKQVTDRLPAAVRGILGTPRT